MPGEPIFGFVKVISIRAPANLQSLDEISKIWGQLLLENLIIAEMSIDCSFCFYCREYILKASINAAIMFILFS
jgi:hypothetical protein